MPTRLAGRSMAQSTICPYCNAKLRLSASTHRPTRVKCQACRRSFHPSQVVVNDGTAHSLNEPLTKSAQPTATPAMSSEQPHHPDEQHSTRVAEQEPPRETEAEPSAADSISPVVAGAAFPAEILARRAARRDAAKERIAQRDRRRKKHRMKAYEIALAIGMVTAGVAGASYLGWYLLKSPGAPENKAAITPPMTDSSDTATRTALLLDGDFAPKPLPKRLIGTWELRGDDERRGWVEFRADHQMLARAWTADVEKTPTQSNWYLVEEVGDDLIIDIGAERGALGNIRFFLTLSGNDAYTLTSVAQRGIRQREDQRFVKRAPQPPARP